jgi:malate dehydrogenase
MDCKRTTGWISGLNLAEIIEAIAADSGRLLPCSAVLTGEFGYGGVAAGVLCTIGKTGILQRSLPALTEEQRRLLDEAVAKIKGQISMAGL